LGTADQRTKAPTVEEPAEVPLPPLPPQPDIAVMAATPTIKSKRFIATPSLQAVHPPLSDHG